MNATRARQYYQLVKPGIVYGNLLTAGAAFLFAAHHIPHTLISLWLFAATLLGLGLSIGAGCVLNNIIERDSDAFMERTKNRVLPMKQISVRHALIYACVLGVAGLGILWLFTNAYALLTTVFGIFVYVCVYTPAKRHTVHSTILGAFAGAVPPIVGYVAVANAIDLNAILLLLILVSWQMPHFFAIALYRGNDYQNAGLPVMPERVGVRKTQALMLVHAVLFGTEVAILGLLNHLQLAGIIVMGIACLGWVLYGFKGFKAPKPARWARAMFLYSLILLLLLSALLALA